MTRITLPSIVTPQVDAALQAAGGMVKVGTTNLAPSGGAEVADIPTGYQSLFISLRGVSTPEASSSSIRFNDDTATNYRWQLLEQNDAGSVSPQVDKNATLIRTHFARERVTGWAVVTGYATSGPKLIMGEQFSYQPDAPEQMRWTSFRGVWLGSDPITKVRWAATLQTSVLMEVWGRGV